MSQQARPVPTPAPEPSDVERAAWRNFLQAHRRVLDVLEHELREDADVPLGWFDVLVQLSEADGRGLRMQELADAVLLSKSGLTRLIDRMEQAGLVAREPCPDDGRGVLAVPTTAGLDTLEATAPIHQRGVREHFLDLLTPEETATIADALGRVAAKASAD